MADLTESEVAVATRCPPENVVRVWPAVLAELKGRAAGGRLSQIGAAATILVETAKFLPVVENLNYGAEGLRKTWPKRFPSPTVALEYARKPEAIANYVYASRNGNGDEASGDGWRYRGRGLIQLTGRRNYRNAGLALGPDYEADPDLVLDLTHAAPIFAWYWAEHGLPQVCETAQWDTARQIVNGGEIGLEAFKACIRRFGVAAQYPLSLTPSAWLWYTADPGWLSWVGFQMTRVAGTAAFCAAVARAGRPHLTLHRRAA